MLGVQMWLRQNQVGWRLAGNMAQMVIGASFEAISGTGQAAFVLAPTVQNARAANIDAGFTGFVDVATIGSTLTTALPSGVAVTVLQMSALAAAVASGTRSLWTPRAAPWCV